MPEDVWIGFCHVDPNQTHLTVQKELKKHVGTRKKERRVLAALASKFLELRTNPVTARTAGDRTHPAANLLCRP